MQPTSRRGRRRARIARMPELTVVEHPVLADRLVILRDRATSHGAFRRALEEASAILAIEATRDLPTRDVTVETPLEPANGDRLLGEVAIVPVLRAGLGMVDGFLRLLPEARVGHLGMYRDEVDHAPVDYFERLPPGLADAHVIVPDPMLATGGGPVPPPRPPHEAGGRPRAAPGPGGRGAAAAARLPRVRARGRQGGQRRPSGRADLDGRARPRA